MKSALTARTGFILAAAGLLVGHALVFDFVNDDAFISFRYADNLVRHGELVYNLGERVEGYTNFLWTMLVAGGMSLGLDPVPFSKALGVLFAALALGLVARFTGRMEEAPSRWDALAPGLLAAAPAYACWATGGLETALFTCLVTAGWTQYLVEREGRGRIPWSGAWFALAAMTRPEGLLFFGLTGLHRLGEMIFADRTLKPTARDWLWGGAFLIVYGPYFAWRYSYYGHPFPNTYYVKAGAKSFWGPGLRYFWSWVSVHCLWAVPALAAIRRGWTGRRESRFLTLGGLYVLGMSLHVIKVGGDFMALHRFLVPLMPVLAVMAAMGLRGLWLALRRWGQPARRLSLGALAMTIGLGVHVARVDQQALKIGSEGGVDSIGWLSWFADQTATMGKWLGETAPPDATLAITAAGIIPYYSRLKTLDLLGLNDAWIAHHVKASGNRPGHTKHAPHAYVEEWAPTYYIGHPDPSLRKPRGRTRPGYTWEATQIPGLRVEPKHARRPDDKEADAWWGLWKRKAR